MNTIENFIGALFSLSDFIEVRCLHPRDPKRCPPLIESTSAHDLPRDAALLARLRSANERGYGVYFGANPRRFRGGTKGADVACARCLYVDLDRTTIDDARRMIDDAGLPAPTALVDSGHGAHIYWRLDKSMSDLDEWRAYMKALIATLPAADRAVHDPPRVMRLPGSFNTKGAPVECRLFECHPGRVYSLADFPQPADDPKSERPGIAAATFDGAARVNGTAAYVRAAVDAECGAVASTPEGGRNARLNAASFALGQLIGGGVLDRAEAERSLKDAARACGLPDSEAVRTIRSGIGAGIREPRGVPERASVKGGDDDAEGGRPAKVNLATTIARLALERFHIGRAPDGAAFAVEKDGPNLALSLRGGRSGLRQRIALAFMGEFGSAPNAAALADALCVLEGRAMSAEPEEAHLRIARHGDSIVYDLGSPDGAAAVIDATGWRILDRSPVLFRRSELTSPTPRPEPGDDAALAELHALLNVADEDWPLVIGWIIAALIPDIDHPLMLTGGMQGTGKTTLAEILLGIVDPSPAPTRSPPSDIDGWSVAMRGSYCACIDNISTIPTWFSDALCCASTGAGLVKRSLYTDGDISVLTFRRALILTSIDPGALKGDLADRLLLIDLETIPATRRRSKSDLMRLFDEARPRIVGAVLSLLARVLAALPGVKLDSMPRMADFARVLAAVDSVTGWRSLDTYLGQGQRIAETVIDSDLVARAVADFTRTRGEWTGTASELFTAITPTPPPKGWPRAPHSLSGALRRCAPALAVLGVTVSFDRDSGKGRRRGIHLSNGKSDDPSVRSVRSVREGEESRIASPCGGSAPDAPGGGAARSVRAERPTEYLAPEAMDRAPDASDASDAPSALSSTSDIGAFCSDTAEDEGGAE